PVHETASDRSTSRKGGSIGRAVPVIVAQAEARDFVIRRRTIGILESPAIVVVGSRIDSQVLAQHIVDGQLVRQGDLLFTLDDREIQALIARDQALLAKQVAPQQQVDQATAANKAAQQTVEADQAVLQADRLKLGYAKLE